MHKRNAWSAGILSTLPQAPHFSSYQCLFSNASWACHLNWNRLSWEFYLKQLSLIIVWSLNPLLCNICSQTAHHLQKHNSGPSLCQILSIHILANILFVYSVTTLVCLHCLMFYGDGVSDFSFPVQVRVLGFSEKDAPKDKRPGI